MEKDKYFMQEAIKAANDAEQIGEVPIGAIVVYEDNIIGRGYNLRETNQKSTDHAEIIAINEACKTLGTWRLENTTIYITLEPCPMCAGAIIQSRIPRVVFGALDPKGGCGGSIHNLLNEEKFNHRCEVINGVMADECGALLSNFFKEIRSKKSKI
ncbi:MAG: tRNA specific adenosine deaminase [Bacillales bacterium]|jgi:tRNA(adenine34) deaminase|nr:tRNA specific adenosine deaminase [Bacillales bacterium]